MRESNSLAIRHFEDGSSALVDSEFGEFPRREEELDSALDLSRGECLFLGVDGELAGLCHDSLEHVRDDLVDLHVGLLGDAAIGLQLLQRPEDVDLEGSRVPHLQLLLLDFADHHRRGVRPRLDRLDRQGIHLVGQVSPCFLYLLYLRWSP